MEGETSASIENQLSIFHERVLPTLDENIKSGNSLIDTDYYDNQLDFGEVKKIKPFNWQRAFPEVFNRKTESPKADLKILAQKAKLHAEKALHYISELEEELSVAKEPAAKYYDKSGFDIVIGNPPYGGDYGNELKHYLANIYHLPIPIADTFLMFLKRAYQISKPFSLISFIVPSTWLYMPQYLIFRKQLINQFEINEIQLFRQQVFENVTVETCTIITSNRIFDSKSIISFKEIQGKSNLFQGITNKISQESLSKENEPSLVLKDFENKYLFDKIKRENFALKDVALTVCGLTPYRLGKGKPPQNARIVKERSFDADFKKDDTYRQYLMGRDFNRYSLQIEKQRWISYGDWLAEPRYKAPFNDETKIVVRQNSDRIIAYMDTLKFLSFKNVHNIRVTNGNLCYEYLLGLLNSNLVGWWYQQLIPEKGRVFAEVKVVNLEKLPIKIIDQKNTADKANYDEIVRLVGQLLQLNIEIKDTKLQSQIDQLQQHIAHCEDKINRLVYQIYGLSDNEIKMVEGN